MNILSRNSQNSAELLQLTPSLSSRLNQRQAIPEPYRAIAQLLDKLCERPLLLLDFDFKLHWSSRKAQPYSGSVFREAQGHVDFLNDEHQKYIMDVIACINAGRDISTIEKHFYSCEADITAIQLTDKPGGCMIGLEIAENRHQNTSRFSSHYKLTAEESYIVRKLALLKTPGEPLVINKRSNAYSSALVNRICKKVGVANKTELLSLMSLHN